jgi:integrase
VQWPAAGEVEVRLPKYGSERTVYIPDELVTELGRHGGQLEGDGNERWLFPSSRGHSRPLNRSTFNLYWREARDAIGAQDLRFHCLRHFYASGLIAAGCDVVTVQRAMGHRDAATTLRVYAHLWPTAEDKTRGAAAELMSATGSAADSVRTGLG